MNQIFIELHYFNFMNAWHYGKCFKMLSLKSSFCFAFSRGSAHSKRIFICYSFCACSLHAFWSLASLQGCSFLAFKSLIASESMAEAFTRNDGLQTYQSRLTAGYWTTQKDVNVVLWKDVRKRRSRVRKLETWRIQLFEVRSSSVQSWNGINIWLQRPIYM